MASPSGNIPRSGTPATRASERARQRVSQARPGGVAAPSQVEDSGRLAQTVAAASSQGMRLTWRMTALVGVLVILLFSYTTSLRVYFSQQAQLAAAKAQVQKAQQAIDDLNDQLTRWQDPAYVEAQARARLGWVVPGETGFQVIDANGQPLGSGATLGSNSALPSGDQAATWWGRLLGTMATADNPAPG